MKLLAAPVLLLASMARAAALPPVQRCPPLATGADAVPPSEDCFSLILAPGPVFPDDDGPVFSKNPAEDASSIAARAPSPAGDTDDMQILRKLHGKGPKPGPYDPKLTPALPWNRPLREGGMEERAVELS
ncbi:hypothetical protein J7T55_012306 [Diaporthe amygdali]|uniref:uncharacterized protein n=1 Tax=Phomopsis amygdali TaxID=1214568 RepID=UPI0022FE3BF6|nr:uncharacterized protein J7T55_012306 [Diaporthe amygdali]KAJ0123836.1 hypothetical protein J7T55_012306 [Diaporthe amygdali]